MKCRCFLSTNRFWADYGGRGITVCDRWRDSFAAFLTDVGVAPTPKHSIDRIDVNGNYEPGNVRWATQAEQKLNTRVNAILTARGKSQPLMVWARETGIPFATLYSRWRNYGWDPERVISEPAHKHSRAPITVGGRSMSAADWSRELGISHNVILERRLRGDSDERCLRPLNAPRRPHRAAPA